MPGRLRQHWDIWLAGGLSLLPLLALGDFIYIMTWPGPHDCNARPGGDLALARYNAAHHAALHGVLACMLAAIGAGYLTVKMSRRRWRLAAGAWCALVAILGFVFFVVWDVTTGKCYT